MAHKNLLYNRVLATVLILCFWALPVTAAEITTVINDNNFRNIADVPTWITSGIGVKTPEMGGYFVNEPLPNEHDGFSYGGWADSIRLESEIPFWILIVIGISGIITISLIALQFLPAIISRTREVSPSPVREEVLSIICDVPGSSATYLKEKTGIHRATLRYHLDILEKEQRIITRKSGHTYYYFPNGSSLTYADIIRLTICQNPTTDSILKIINAEPGISGTVLASRAGITSSTLTWHLTRLEKNELIVITRIGRGMQIFPNDQI